MALPDNWRINIRYTGNIGVSTTLITIKYRGKYFGTDGKLTYGSESSNIYTTGSTLNDNYVAGSAVDNSAETNPFVEADLYIYWNLSGMASVPRGSFLVYLQASTDGGTTWPTNGGGQVIASKQIENKDDTTFVLVI